MVQRETWLPYNQAQGYMLTDRLLGTLKQKGHLSLRGDEAERCSHMVKQLHLTTGTALIKALLASHTDHRLLLYCQKLSSNTHLMVNEQFLWVQLLTELTGQQSLVSRTWGHRNKTRSQPFHP